MLTYMKLPADRHYENKTPFEPIEFYLNALCNSTKWDLLLGYFSSAAINVLSLGFATFIHNGGVLRLVINNVLSQEDKNVIEQGGNDDLDLPFDISDIVKLRESLDQYNRHFFECLAWLISHDRIQIKIIAPKEGQGISHYKSGQFYDENNNTIYFHGSCNMTAFGLLKNLEEVDITTSWDNDLSKTRVESFRKKFNSIFDGSAKHVKYLQLNDVITAVRDEFGNKEIGELLIEERELLELKRNSYHKSPKIIKAIEMAEAIIDRKAAEPRHPYPFDHRGKYQLQAYLNWCDNNYQGIFAMATGTGKTITSLNCLLNLAKKEDGYRAIILVPTIALVDQWRKECESFNYSNIFLVSSRYRWEESVASIRTSQLLGNKKSFIIISTYASFNLAKFQREFKHLSSDTLLIADEAHNLGSPSLLRKLPQIHLTRRIGLSATPEKQYDEEANQKIKSFFNEQNRDNYTFEYSMEEAIRNDLPALCHYRYFPRIVRLTDAEFEDYIELTKRISRLPEPRNKEQDELFKMLCLKRQIIIHKAHNKLGAFKEIVEKELNERGNLKFTLVYTPEGDLPEFDAVRSEEIAEQEEGIKLINEYTKVISDLGNKITVRKFVGASQGEDRIRMLKDFASGALQVLTSMKCLDEGVDVPRAELAIFCSSTGNPRQFIQRRGRVLRKHPDKEISGACIYDLVVIPEVSEDLDLMHIERNEIAKELRRVKSFADLSDNPYYAAQILKPFLDYYELSI